jgi:glucuronoarabinoxylan endo-1,4-beta-xylanase
MKQAAGFGVTQIWAASWTPPVAYKQNGLTHGKNNNNNFTGAASGNANSADIGYATYLVNYIKNCNNQLSSYGIKLLAISPQNEPDWDTDYESCIWSAGQFAVFAKELYAQLQTAGLSTKIMIPESFRDDKTLAATAMNDATIAPMIGVIGNHLYGITNNNVLFTTPYSLANSGFTHVTTQEQWETEMSDVSGAGNDTSITSGLVIAGWIQACIVGASMNAYHHWWMRAYDGAGDTNEVLVPQANTATKKLWCLGNWSRFVRPGFTGSEPPRCPPRGCRSRLSRTALPTPPPSCLWPSTTITAPSR